MNKIKTFDKQVFLAEKQKLYSQPVELRNRHLNVKSDAVQGTVAYNNKYKSTFTKCNLFSTSGYCVY